ncbi:hypothetical protein B0H17DRAFT_918979, partial [Mycena rosella]
WVVWDFIVEPTFLPELKQTRFQLLEFTKDPKYVLGTILNSTSHITFPESEWLAIVKRHTVNLKKAITNQFSVSHERQHAESIGDGVQLLFGSSTPARTVSTHTQWITAWTKAADVITYVFLHCRRELNKYRQYITDLFTSSGEHVHERVIRLNRKLRIEAAGCHDLALNDCAKFSHWERSFLNDNGTAHFQLTPKAKDTPGRGPSSGSGSGGDKQGKSKEPCNCFNEERCPSNKANC